MTTRRDWMTQTSVAAVGAALGLRVLSEAGAPGTAATAKRSEARTLATVQGPAPWALIAPLQVGSSIGNGWRIESLSDVRMGASVLSVRHESGVQTDVHICLRQGQPTGVAASRHFDFVLMNEANGERQTNEALGVALITMARRAELNEQELSRVGFMRHADRLSQFGWEQIA
jgi:hypothetical protein